MIPLTIIVTLYFIHMEKVLFYEKLQEYYASKTQKEQIQMIVEIEAAKTKT